MELHRQRKRPAGHKSTGRFFGLFPGFKFVYDAPDLGGRDVGLLGFGVNRDKDNLRLGLQVINHAVAPAFSPFDIPIRDAHFENSKTCPCHLVAGQFAVLQGEYQWLNVVANMPIFPGKDTHVALELRRKGDIDGHRLFSSIQIFP